MRMSSNAVLLKKTACLQLPSILPTALAQWTGGSLRVILSNLRTLRVESLSVAWIRSAAETTNGCTNKIHNTRWHLEASAILQPVFLLQLQRAYAVACSGWRGVWSLLRTWGSIALEIHLPKWYGSSNSPNPRSTIRSRKNMEEILGVMHQDQLPNLAIRIARPLLVVYHNPLHDRAALTKADRAFCRNWTAHKRNLYLKEFGFFCLCQCFGSLSALLQSMT